MTASTNFAAAVAVARRNAERWLALDRPIDWEVALDAIRDARFLLRLAATEAEDAAALDLGFEVMARLRVLDPEADGGEA